MERAVLEDVGGNLESKGVTKSKRIHTYVCQAHTNITLAAQAYQSH